MSRFQIERSGDQATVILAGDLTASLVPELKPPLKALTDEGVKGLTFDVSHTGILDSSGIGLLIAAHNSLKKTGGWLRIRGASRELLELLKVMRLDKHFEIVETGGPGR